MLKLLTQQLKNKTLSDKTLEADLKGHLEVRIQEEIEEAKNQKLKMKILKFMKKTTN